MNNDHDALHDARKDPARTPIAAARSGIDAEQELDDLAASRLRDYLRESLLQASATVAALASVNHGMFQIARKLEAAIRDALSEEPLTLEQTSEIQPMLNTYLRMVREIERYAQTQMRAAAPRENSIADPSLDRRTSQPRSRGQPR
jgi:hypothetical protein